MKHCQRRFIRTFPSCFNPFELPPRLLGADNYTEGETPDLDLLNEAWERSPVSVMSSIEANTLIFVGKDHRALVPQRQGSEWTSQSQNHDPSHELANIPFLGGLETELLTITIATRFFDSIARFQTTSTDHRHNLADYTV